MKMLIAGLIALGAVGLAAGAVRIVESSGSLAWLDTRYPIVEEMAMSPFDTNPGGMMIIIR